MILGCAVYYDLYHGIPKENFPEKMAMLSKFGVDIGEINHSKNFPDNFSKAVQVVMKERVQHFLSKWTSSSIENSGIQSNTQTLDQEY